MKKKILFLDLITLKGFSQDLVRYGVTSKLLEKGFRFDEFTINKKNIIDNFFILTENYGSWDKMKTIYSINVGDITTRNFYQSGAGASDFNFIKFNGATETGEFLQECSLIV